MKDTLSSKTLIRTIWLHHKACLNAGRNELPLQTVTPLCVVHAESTPPHSLIQHIQPDFSPKTNPIRNDSQTVNDSH